MVRIINNIGGFFGNWGLLGIPTLKAEKRVKLHFPGISWWRQLNIFETLIKKVNIKI